MTTAITPVILCGGSGTRLWPRSRVSCPKPFLPLVGETSLFEQTIARCSDAEGFHPPLVVAGASHVPLIEQQLGNLKGARIIVEPSAKNTAAAIALAALRLPADAVMLVCPSDHHVGKPRAFVDAALRAAELAREGWLVAFGIEAKTPETGYGYLRRGEKIGEGGYRVAQFVEKPDAERARAFMADGGYAWNGGIFAFTAGTYLAELGAHRPDIANACSEAVEKGHEDGRRFLAEPRAFNALSGESIDYAVMEKTTRAAMVPAEMDWSDIGNWQALHAARPQDAAGNSIKGTAELVDCRNVLVESDGPRVSVIGLENVIVVVDGDEVLVTSATGAQKVGKLPGAASQ